MAAAPWSRCPALGIGEAGCIPAKGGAAGLPVISYLQEALAKERLLPTLLPLGKLFVSSGRSGTLPLRRLFRTGSFI